MDLFGGIYLVAVVFGVVSGDITCFIEKQTPRITELIYSYPGFNTDLCRPAREYFLTTREDAKTCSLKRISVDDLLSFTKDFCTVGCDLNNKYLKHETCFGINFGNAIECIKDFKPPNKSIEVEYVKDICSKLEEIYDCFNVKVGTPCGKEALELTSSFTKSLSAYTKGICLEVNGTSFTKLQWNVLIGLLLFLTIWYKVFADVNLM